MTTSTYSYEWDQGWFMKNLETNNLNSHYNTTGLKLIVSYPLKGEIAWWNLK